VLNVLVQNGVPVTPERIVIGVPIPNGLSGVEALAGGRSLENMRIRRRDSAVGSGGGAFGSTIVGVRAVGPVERAGAVGQVVGHVERSL